ncbi:MAG: hypothetical protein R3277_12895 [Brumimicrobium sp.]|nr:hypothetical protein [Brumimicrobium sp.]
MKTVILLIIGLLHVLTGYVQVEDERTAEIKEKIRQAEEKGDFKKSVKYKQKLIKLDPGAIEYRFDLAETYLKIEKYDKTLGVLNEIIADNMDNPSVYQMKSDVYLLKENISAAIATIEKGIEKFPDDGKLYFYAGRYAMMQKEYENALSYFEEGILKDPNYPSNYYWACKIYCSSTEEVWGLIYGELFINIERNTSRTEEISALLYKTLQREIRFESDSLVTVSLCQNANFNPQSEEQLEYGSFGQKEVELNLIKTLSDVEYISLRTINDVRHRFIKFYMESRDSSIYPIHALFEFHKRLIDLGHFEAYNYWLFMMGDTASFEYWEGTNAAQWIRFLDWYQEHQLQMFDKDHFHRKHF